VQLSTRTVDLFVTFTVGPLTDACVSPIGKRKPFLLLGLPSLVVGLLMLSHPPSLSTPPVKHLREHEKGIPRIGHEGNNCTIIRSTLAHAIEAGRVSELLGTGSVHSNHSKDVRWLAASFAIFAIAGMTFTVIPYDALGQDLAQGPDTRATLFGTKAFLQFAAMITAIFMTLILSIEFPSSIYHQVDLLSRCGAILVGTFGTLLLLYVKDSASPGKTKQDHHDDDIVFIIRSLATNSPFLQYLTVRVLIAMAFHLPPSLLVSYMKYTLYMENSVKASAIMQLSFLPLVAIYLSMCNKWVRRMPARYVWQSATCLFVVAHALVSCLPHDVIRTYHLLNFVFPLYYPLLTASSLVVPNLLLAEVLDYDRLRTGKGRQAMFVMFDHLIIQALDVLVSSLPSLALASMGFVGNGGCSCGCGVACSRPYLRWNCPGDVGFACSSVLDASNVPFFGIPNRRPPCLLQTQRVLWGFDVMMFHIPISCCLVASITLSNYLMNDMINEEIKCNLVRMKAGLVAYDPVRNETIRTSDNATGMLGQDESDLVDAFRGLAPLMKKLRRDTTNGLILAFLFSAILLTWSRGPGIWLAVPLVPSFYALWSIMKLAMVSRRKASLYNYLVEKGQQHSVSGKSPTPFAKTRVKAWLKRVQGRGDIHVWRSKRRSVS